MSQNNFYKIEELEKYQHEHINVAGTQMTVGEYARWLLLIEAFQLITDTEEETGDRFDEYAFAGSSKRHKAILRFISDRYWAMVADIKQDLEANKAED